ncbi:MAG TPA: M48 family metallopeptidase, partial [Isosphaeraceae bacterium]|nr:M48 family metallopeptidase [Isosphaeraceae bacterium]
IDLPLDYYLGFVRPHAYGLSHQHLSKWLVDHVTALGVDMLMGVAVVWVPFWLIRRFPRRWWLITAVLTVPFLFFMALVKPVWFDPLFNDFGPMKDRALERRIVALAHRAGIDGSRIYEVNKSVDTDTVNAYVTGFLGTRRIVLWDTLLAKLDDREVLVVMGHEMGHYALNHVVRSLLLLSLLNLVGLYVVHRLAGWILARWPERLRLSALSDIASLPLFVLLLNAAAFVSMPLVCAYSRHQEHEADRFALEITHMNHSGAEAFVKLQRDNLSVPRPGWFYTLWRATHPSIGDRIDFCNTYHPWRTGQQSEYEDLVHIDGSP